MKKIVLVMLLCLFGCKIEDMPITFKENIIENMDSKIHYLDGNFYLDQDECFRYIKEKYPDEIIVSVEILTGRSSAKVITRLK